MKMNKIAAAFVSGAVAASAMAVTAFADDSITATLGFTDTNWTYQDWESSVEITGDGQYTITSELVAGTEEIGVFVIDCNGMFAAYPDATATLDSIEVDGAAVSFDASKIIYGDVEEKGNYRIEIYNMYGDSKNDPGFSDATAISSSLSVTFTVAGMGGTAAQDDVAEDVPANDTAVDEPVDDTPASDNVTDSVPTGNTAASAAAAVVAVAGVTAIAARKRK